MKFKLTFKTPDVFDDIDDEFEDEESREVCKEFARKYMKYSEYITIEFDTVAETATVMRN